MSWRPVLRPAICLAMVVIGCSSRSAPVSVGSVSGSSSSDGNGSSGRGHVVPAAQPYAGTIVELRGTGAQMGAQHADQLAAQINLLHENYLKVYIGSGTHRLLALAAAQLFESYFPPGNRDEVAALAQHSRMDEREAALAQCFLDLSPMTACSTITLPASAAPDGVARFGRNLDFPSLNIADKYSTVFIYHPQDGYAFASIGWPGMIGVLSGMNEHGLALANMEITRPARMPGAMPYTLLYRQVLERCRTVPEAIQFLRATPRQTANNLMLMDATGDRAVVEIQPDAVTVRQPRDADALLSTNHQRGVDSDTAGRCWRYDALRRVSRREFGHIDLPALEGLLARVSPGASTLQSMVFEPAHCVIYLSTGEHAAAGRFDKLDLAPYFDHASGNAAALAR